MRLLLLLTLPLSLAAAPTPAETAALERTEAAATRLATTLKARVVEEMGGLAAFIPIVPSLRPRDSSMSGS